MSDEPKDDGFEEWAMVYRCVNGNLILEDGLLTQADMRAAYHAGRNSRDAEVERLKTEVRAGANLLAGSVTSQEYHLMKGWKEQLEQRIAKLEKALALEQVESHRLRHLRTTGQ
jgi:hypothetical protein